MNVYSLQFLSIIKLNNPNRRLIKYSSLSKIYVETFGETISDKTTNWRLFSQELTNAFLGIKTSR